MSDGHPAPSDDLHERPLDLIEFETDLWRITHRKYRDSPLFFGSTGQNRFDDPGGSFGVCYFSPTFQGAFLETFGRDLHMNLVTPQALSSRLAVNVSVEPRLRLVDLTNRRLRLLGADSRLNSTMNRQKTQRWSEAMSTTLNETLNHYWFGLID